MIIDLTKTIYDDMPVYEGDPKVSLKQINHIDSDGFSNHLLSINMHAGTHVDGLAHMLKDRPTIDEVSLSTFIGLARYVEDDTVYQKANEDCLVVKMTRTVLNEAFIDSIIDAKIKLIVIEKESPDEYPYHTHLKLFNAGILIVENAVNFDLIKDLGYVRLFVIPLKIKADSSPARVFVETL